MNGDLKQTFILHVMRETMDLMNSALVASIRKNKIGASNDLVNSIRTESFTSGQGAIGRLIFDEQGRMVDMGVGRKYPLGGIQAVTETLLSSNKEGIALVKKQGRRPKKWYSKVAYGKLEFLEKKLMYGFTEEARKELLKMQTKNGI